MDEYESLSHYEVGVQIPRGVHSRNAGGRRCTRSCGGTWGRCSALAEQKESRIEEGHLMADHVHMMISIPPKYAVSQVIGFIKGKSAIHLARVYGERKRNFVGRTFGHGGFSYRR